MGKQTISIIKNMLDNDKVNEEILEELMKDERKGVQKLIHTYEKRLAKERELEKNYLEMCHYEQSAFGKGKQFVAGIDEAGRGPLAGPVVAAAVILPHDFKLLGLNDSKQINEATREKFYSIIKKEAISYGVSIISNETIDEVNIFEATKLAMREAVNQLEPKPDHVLIDAVHLNGLPCTSESIIKGDAKSISIAAASILAKVSRDILMKEIHQKYPNYDFISNMGYGTKHHMDMLKAYGATPYHRKSFAPVRDVLTIS
ncbi:ribonuclease HII [Oceanobacillus sp. 143]|uniref:Ribonuclease HII n=1 Tax=Oceanobacillus zhaokaii TaxID=2052660 RepID=A0A345PGD6_9BACI|nr:ribonuclease HII [Oceanobacillus zhaokaii]AXI09066.1 ribonuclease HII [Oceanobacillus zhaokaii]QGS68640.1 ribonuclease HII [Oceanobacillus sp. 143]